MQKLLTKESPVGEATLNISGSASIASPQPCASPVLTTTQETQTSVSGRLGFF